MPESKICPFVEKDFNRLLAKHEKLLSHNRVFFQKHYSWSANEFDECLNMVHNSWRSALGKNRFQEEFFKKVCVWWYEGDLRALQKQDDLSLEIAMDIKKLNMVSPEDNWAFITVGWNEQVVTPKTMLYASLNIASLKYFISVKYVLEKHRENGIHHHTHFLVKFDTQIFKSKMIDWIFQTKGVKSVCLGKNFIDVKGPLNKKKPYQTYQLYEDYVNGVKKEEKKKYIELDRKWRKDNDILDIYERNNL